MQRMKRRRVQKGTLGGEMRMSLNQGIGNTDNEDECVNKCWLSQACRKILLNVTLGFDYSLMTAISICVC